MSGGAELLARVVAVLTWYLIGFGPSIFAGYLYYRQDRSVGRLRAFFLGHALIPCNYIAFVSCWRAAFRSLLGRTGWNKTVRRAEPGFDPVAALWPYSIDGLATAPVIDLARSTWPLPETGPAIPALLSAPAPVLAPRRSLTLTGSVSRRGPEGRGISRRVLVTGRFRPSDPTPVPERPEPDRGPHAA